VAKELGFIYVDTGAMYRTIALACNREGISAKEHEKVAEKCESVDVSLGYEDGTQKVYLNGEDVSTLIRQEEIGNMTSAIAVYPEVRKKMVEMQKKFAKENNVVMDGRDIGTVVFPEAELKIFLTASPEIRAQRRMDEMQAKGQTVEFNEVLANVIERDERDVNRAESPLRKADDAIEIDNSQLSPAEQRDLLRTLFQQKVLD
jgi:cytidylate kinase